MTTPDDLALGRNGTHRYNITPAPPMPGPKYLKDGVTLAKHQPKRPKPKFDTVGVTTISGMLEKGGLVWGASKETALLAVHGKDEWMHLDDDAAVNKLRTHFRHVWDLKSETGTIVHSVALAWAKGEQADLEQLLAYDENGVLRDWSAEEHNEVLRRVDGCLSALELFYLEQRPKWNLVERTLIHPGIGYRHGDPYTFEDHRIDRKTSWGGQVDGDVELKDHGHVLLDWKTGQRYLDSVTLQVSGGYGNCKLLGNYDAEGHLVSTEPYQAPKKKVVVYLRDDGEYELVELPQGRPVYQRFVGLRRTHAWLADMRAFEKEHPSPFDQPETDFDAGEIETQPVQATPEQEQTAA